MKCPNINCRNFNKSMENIGKLSRDFTNHGCLFCGTHYYGNKGKEKWYNPEEWKNYVNVVDGVDFRKKYA